MIKTILSIIFGICILILFLGTTGYLYHKSQEPPVIFETVSPVMGDIENITMASGVIVPRQEIVITPRASGRIEKIYVQAGDKVQRGETLAKIQIVPDLVRLNEAENRLNKAQIAYADAKQEVQRQEKLYKKQLISQSEFKRYQVTFETTSAELQSAQKYVRLIKEGVVKQEAGDNTLIQSIVDGTILAVPVKVGDTVVEANGFNSGTPVAVIADMSALVFEGSISESDVGKLHKGIPLHLTIGAIEDHTFKATLEYIALKGIKERDGAVQFRFKAVVEPKEGVFIRAGYSANAKIVLAKKENVLTLPESLIRYTTDQQPYVEIEVSEQQFEKRNLKLGISDGIHVEVLSGLTVNDKVKKPYPNA